MSIIGNYCKTHIGDFLLIFLADDPSILRISWRKPGAHPLFCDEMRNPYGGEFYIYFLWGIGHYWVKSESPGFAHPV
jgi:hypothetical protein